MATDPNSTIAVEQPITPAPNPSLRLLSVDARATPSDFGGGAGLESVSKGLGDFSDAMMEVSQKRDALFAQQVATKAEVDWRQNMAQAQQAFTLDPSKGINYADTYKQQFNDYQEKVLANNPNITQNAKNQVMSRLNSVGATMFDNALSLQAKASTDWSVQSYQNTTDNIKQIANGQDAFVKINDDGSVTSSFDNARDQLTEAVKTAKGVVPTAMLRDSLLSNHLELDKAEIDTSTQQNGAFKTAQLIQDGKLGTSLTIPQRLMQVQELQRQGRIEAETTLQSTSKDLTTFIDGVKMGVVDANDPRGKALISSYANASGDLKDIHESIAEQALQNAAKEGFDQRAVDSFPQVNKEDAANNLSAVTNKASQIGGNVIPYDVNAITANYGISKVNPNESPKAQIYTAQEAAQAAQKQIESAQLVGVARQKMLSMNPQQAHDYFQGLQNSLGSDHPALKDIATFEDQRQKLLYDPKSSDSARVALTDKSIYTANANAESITQSFLNPGMMKGTGLTPTPQQVQGANANAISKIYAFQDQVGVPHTPLTNQQADFLANQFIQASAKSPEQAIQLKNQLKQAYPSQYQSDVIGAIPLGTKLSLFMGMPSGSQQERNFAESLAVTDKDKNIGEKTKATLDKAFDPANNSDISNFLQSQISNGYTGTELKKTISEIQGSLRDYATVLAIKNKSNDISSAIAQAPKDVLGTIFGYTNINGQTIAIPRSNGSGGFRSDDDISNISQGLQFETNNIFDDKAETQGQNLDLTGALDRYHYQSTEDNHKLAINDLKQNAYWSTGIKGLTKDNEAVLLGFDRLGNRFPILDKQGQAITRDLDTMGNNWIAKQQADKAKQIYDETHNDPKSTIGGGVNLHEGMLGKWLDAHGGGGQQYEK